MKFDMRKLSILLLVALTAAFSLRAQKQYGIYSVAFYNQENLFDTIHDEGKNDYDFLPSGSYHWNKMKYEHKLANMARALLDLGTDKLPGIGASVIGLAEVENSRVLDHLTALPAMRERGMKYVHIEGPDRRGIDVALLYNPFSFQPIRHRSIRVEPVEGMRPTRDILYVAGKQIGDDTLHVFVVHAPSRYGGERRSRPFRLAVAQRLCGAVDSVYAVSSDARIVIAGDFNDDADGHLLQRLCQHHRVRNITKDARGMNGVKGTYRYKGQWGSIDHVLASRAMESLVDSVYIHSPKFLLEEETLYGGYRPRRTYKGMRYQPGYSDHLPLVVRFRK